MALSVPWPALPAPPAPTSPAGRSPVQHTTLPAGSKDKSVPEGGGWSANSRFPPQHTVPVPVDSSPSRSISSGHSYASWLPATRRSIRSTSLAYAARAHIQTRRPPASATTGTTSHIPLPPRSTHRHDTAPVHSSTPGKPAPSAGLFPASRLPIRPPARPPSAIPPGFALPGIPPATLMQ